MTEMSVRTGGRSVDVWHAWETSHKESVTLPPSEQGAYLLDTIGARFTTAAVGLNDARTVHRWTEESVGPREHAVAARLRVLYRVTRVISEMYSPAVAMAFLRSANPHLPEEISPLRLLREGDPEHVEAPLLDAVRAFLEG